MSEKVEMETKREKGQVSEQLGRVWSEIKQISKQVERETRKSGRVSRLRLEIHRLRREKKVAQSQLGQAVHAALQEHGDSIALSEVEELANSAATINILIEKIIAREAEVQQLRQAEPGDDQPLETSGEVA
ncbi:MAG TPA: hypothetical protein QGG30_07760 [Acidobacteriota bacterium]|jgi:hypothetical protein|nr:hypothetical protein [Acidobacteriota bacterium]|tara:strand:- start:2315 stop:2707 length:393 start_codon:yes stop_codon:yes gene_type:complete